MKSLASLALLFLLAPALRAESAPDLPIQSALVRVEVSRLRPSYAQPWAPGKQSRGSGTGFLLEGGHLVTCAHLVADATFVEVRRSGEARRYAAEVRFAGHDSDLALLHVADPAFLEGMTPLPLGALPPLGAAVSVLGFAGRGEQVAVTAGVVSRLEMQRVPRSLWVVASLQVDAAVNRGNSGGPVLVDGRVAGVVFRADGDAENVSWAVPAPLVRQFLDDTADGRLDGIPDSGFVFQSGLNPAMRRWLGAAAEEGGVLVQEVAWGGSADGVLEPGDLLLAVDGHPVASDGMVDLRPGERIELDYLPQQRQVGERLPVVFRRAGERRTGALRLAPAAPLVGVHFDRPASYLILGGLVVQPLTYNFFLRYGDESDGAVARFGRFLFDLRSRERQEVLVVGQVLADPVNLDYEDAVDETLVRANGRPVASLAELAAALREPERGFHRLEFENGFVVVFDAEEEAAARPRIFQRYSIPADRSHDLRE